MIYYDCINDLIEPGMNTNEVAERIKEELNSNSPAFFDKCNLTQILNLIINPEYPYAFYDNKTCILKYSLINNQFEIIDIIFLTREEVDKMLMLA